jgi:predicted Holliday junction resolvase-like endonuclease
MALPWILVALLAIAAVVAGSLARRRGRAMQEMRESRATAIAEARKDSRQRSRRGIDAATTENMAPLLPGYPHQYEVRYLGSRADQIAFVDTPTGLEVYFIEVKGGASQPDQRQRGLEAAIRAGRVFWQLVRVVVDADDGSAHCIVERTTPAAADVALPPARSRVLRRPEDVVGRVVTLRPSGGATDPGPVTPGPGASQ